MLEGTVVGIRPLIGFTIRQPDQPDIVNECIIDTGFEGAPALPADAVTALGHPLYQRIFANLADNSVVRLDGFRAATVWKGQELIVAFLAMGRRPLFGTALLSGKELVARFVDNGLLTVVDV